MFITYFQVTDEELSNSSTIFPHSPPLSKEGFYYRKIFSKYYPDCDNFAPYKWASMDQQWNV